MKNLFLISFIIILFSSLTFSYDIEEKIQIIEDNYRQYYYADSNNEEKEEKINEAINEYVNLISLYPNYSKLYWKIAEVYFSLALHKQNDKSLFELSYKYADTAVEINPKDPDAYYWRALLAFPSAIDSGIFNSLSLVRDIRDDLEKVIKLDPTHYLAYDMLAHLYFNAPGWPLSIGSKRKALENRKLSVKYDPYNYQYRWFLYQYNLDMRNKRDAENNLKEIIEMANNGIGDAETAEEYKKRALDALNENF